mmetsp:Transcript_8302/g.28492  ORF Transcript_8302/g.28492 Transcript_8302/m.28492 type:complete len:207 (-) Transcript_8302:365-985(-)
MRSHEQLLGVVVKLYFLLLNKANLEGGGGLGELLLQCVQLPNHRMVRVRAPQLRHVPLRWLVQVEGSGDGVGEGVRVFGVLAQGLQDLLLRLSEVSHGHVADRAAVQQLRGPVEPVAQLLEDVLRLLDMVTPQGNVDPGVGKLGERRVVVLLLHQVEHLLGDVRPLDLQGDLDGERQELERTRARAALEGLLVGLRRHVDLATKLT